MPNLDEDTPFLDTCDDQEFWKIIGDAVDLFNIPLSSFETAIPEQTNEIMQDNDSVITPTHFSPHFFSLGHSTPTQLGNSQGFFSNRELLQEKTNACPLVPEDLSHQGFNMPVMHHTNYIVPKRTTVDKSTSTLNTQLNNQVPNPLTNQNPQGFFLNKYFSPANEATQACTLTWQFNFP